MSTIKRFGLGLVLSVAVFAFAPPSQASVAGHLRHEARALDCRVEHRSSWPNGPRNRGLICVTHRGQEFQLLHYRDADRAVAWWRSELPAGRWFARHGSVLALPLGNRKVFVDRRAYRHDWAHVASRRLGGRIIRG